MKILPYKATDKELGKVRKDLAEILAVWANQWNMRTLDELPDYVQDMYIAFCYSLWLEDQVMEYKKKDQGEADEILDNRGTDSGNDNHGVAGDAGLISDTKPATGTHPLPKSDDVEQHPAIDGGTGSTGLRTGDASVHVQHELPVQLPATHDDPKSDG